MLISVREFSSASVFRYDRDKFVPAKISGRCCLYGGLYAPGSRDEFLWNRIGTRCTMKPSSVRFQFSRQVGVGRGNRGLILPYREGGVDSNGGYRLNDGGGWRKRRSRMTQAVRNNGGSSGNAPQVRQRHSDLTQRKCTTNELSAQMFDSPPSLNHRRQFRLSRLTTKTWYT